MDKPEKIRSGEITDETTYLNRRNLMRAGVLAVSVAATGWVYRKLNYTRSVGRSELSYAKLLPATGPSESGPGFVVPPLGADEPTTSFEDITHYNNFYEFTPVKESVASAAEGFVTRPWAVEVGGLVAKPKTFDLDDLLKMIPVEERIYRMRCVEGWSMVIPWNGFSLSRLLDRVQPLSSAKYVAFQTLFDPTRMPNEQSDILAWPYVEGLRMDEAMHPLTILASGIYGRQMPPQDGAPVRLVVPWKYGFKGIKSIVKIELRDSQPPTTWNIASPNEYGFYSNVNPNVDHPRWSQATERRLDGSGWNQRPTLIFNGYGDEVAGLYAGMDLRENF